MPFFPKINLKNSNYRRRVKIKKIIGLTGLFCSGKSTVDEIIQNRYGYFSIDVDKIGHIVLEEQKEKLKMQFGEQIIENGKINRKNLGKIVFNDKNKLKLLNSIVHPKMIDKISSIINVSTNEKICINAALLFEMGLYKFCNKIIVVKSNIFNVLIRSRKRDKRGFFTTFKILLNQKALSFAKILKKNTEICYVNNDSTLEKLKKNLDRILSL